MSERFLRRVLAFTKAILKVWLKRTEFKFLENLFVSMLARMQEVIDWDPPPRPDPSVVMSSMCVNQNMYF